MEKPNGYRKVRVNGVSLFEHRVVWAMFHGRWPDNYIDHVNGVRSDNRPENLRDVSHVENMRRSLKRRAKRTSDCGKEMLMGVYKTESGFSVSRKVLGTKHYAGRFKNLDDANKKAKELACRLGLDA